MTVIICVLVFIHIFFLIALLTKKFSVMDIAWGLGFVVIAIVAYLSRPLHLKNALLLAIVTMWGLRLSFHIFKRSLGQPEDFRYAQLRAEWGKSANLQAYLKVFLFQGLLMLVVSLPIIFGMGTELSIINWIGLGIWIFGFAIEVYSDAYLKKYKADPANKGKICMSGPWTLCRFPNYFGEITLWYGVYGLAVTSTSIWTIIGPVVLNIFILKVTGVPFLEEKYKKRAEYHQYAAKVPRLLPFSPPNSL